MTHTPRTKIAILGAGSIGCYLGGLLHSQGLNVVFIGRDKLKHAIAENGLTLTHFENNTLSLPANTVQVNTSASALSDCGVIMICTKSQDTALGAEQINQFADPDAIIISCQNGVSNAAVLETTLKSSEHLIIETIVPFNVTPSGPGRYHCGTAGALHFSQTVPPFIQFAFENAHQETTIGGNFKGDQWAKLLVNLNNALNALSGTTLQKALIQKNYRRALSLCLQEAINIAEASSIDIGKFNGRSPKALMTTLGLPNWAYKIVMQSIVKIDAKARSSMLDDLETGRPSEIDYLQGEVVRQAQLLNRSAPYNHAILKTVKEAFDTGRSPRLSGTEILALLKAK